jgi:hypothetical protein
MKLIRKISFGRQVSAPGFASEHPFRPPNKSTRSRITCANLALAPPPPPPLGYCSAVFHAIIKHTKPDINREHPRVGVRSRAGGGVGGGAGTVLERAVLVVVLAAASAAAPAARHRREPGTLQRRNSNSTLPLATACITSCGSSRRSLRSKFGMAWVQRSRCRSRLPRQRDAGTQPKNKKQKLQREKAREETAAERNN